MDQSMMKGLVVGGLAMVVLGAGAVGGYRYLQPEVAQVVGVKEVTKTVSTPREVCEDVAVRRQAPVQDQNRIAGTAVGAIAGGLLGSAVGNGSGKTLATVAGAVGGGYAGNQVQKNMQQSDTVTTTEQRCRTVDNWSRQLTGYNVTYRYQGHDYTDFLPYDPGRTVKVNVKVSLAERY